MSLSVAIPEAELTDKAITPVFKIIEVENVNQSEIAGYPVMETREVVEIHIAGKANCLHVANVDDFCRRAGNKLITYAEEYSDQYQAFKQGHPQEAKGTPLEMLRAFGVSPAMISLCRARHIYSVEALHQLEGQGLKSLGIEGGKLKEAARNLLAERRSKVDSMAEIEALKAELAALKAQAGGAPASVSASEASDTLENLTNEEMKAMLAERFGRRPQGNPSRDTLLSMLREAA